MKFSHKLMQVAESIKQAAYHTILLILKIILLNVILHAKAVFSMILAIFVNLNDVKYV